MMSNMPSRRLSTVEITESNETMHISKFLKFITECENEYDNAFALY